MKIQYDSAVDAKYVKIQDGKIDHTKKEREWLMFDVAENGEVLGIEILDSSEHPVSVFTINGKFVGWGCVDYDIHENEDKIAMVNQKVESPLIDEGYKLPAGYRPNYSLA